LSKREAQDADEVLALGSRTGADGTIDLFIEKRSTVGRLAQRVGYFLLTIEDAVDDTRIVAANPARNRWPRSPTKFDWMLNKPRPNRL